MNSAFIDQMKMMRNIRSILTDYKNQTNSKLVLAEKKTYFGFL